MFLLVAFFCITAFGGSGDNRAEILRTVPKVQAIDGNTPMRMVGGIPVFAKQADVVPLVGCGNACEDGASAYPPVNLPNTDFANRGKNPLCATQKYWAEVCEARAGGKEWDGYAALGKDELQQISATFSGDKSFMKKTVRAWQATEEGNMATTLNMGPKFGNQDIHITFLNKIDIPKAEFTKDRFLAVLLEFDSSVAIKPTSGSNANGITFIRPNIDGEEGKVDIMAMTDFADLARPWAHTGISPDEAWESFSGEDGMLNGVNTAGFFCERYISDVLELRVNVVWGLPAVMWDDRRNPDQGLYDVYWRHDSSAGQDLDYSPMKLRLMDQYVEKAWLDTTNQGADPLYQFKEVLQKLPRVAGAIFNQFRIDYGRTDFFVEKPATVNSPLRVFINEIQNSGEIPWEMDPAGYDGLHEGQHDAAICGIYNLPLRQRLGADAVPLTFLEKNQDRRQARKEAEETKARLAALKEQRRLAKLQKEGAAEEPKLEVRTSSSLPVTVDMNLIAGIFIGIALATLFYFAHALSCSKAQSSDESKKYLLTEV